MTVRLKPGMHLQLPSGNVVTVLRREGRDAVCEYSDWSRQRGEVSFAWSWLARCSVVVAVGRPVPPTRGRR